MPEPVLHNRSHRPFRPLPMRHVGTLLAGVMVLGACGGEPEGVGFGGAPQPSEAVPPSPPPAADGPIPPPGTERVGPAQVDATALPEGYPRLVWTSEGGTGLGAYGQEGGCSQVRADLVEQTTETVRIIFVEVSPTTGPCTMDLRFPPLTVLLDEPLGDRTVVLERRQIGPPGR